MIQSRRSVITGLVSLIAAPAIVRASSLMPVKMAVDFATGNMGYDVLSQATFEPNEMVYTYLENGVLRVRRYRPEEWRAPLDGP